MVVALVVVSISFLFAGFYKPYIPSPFDLTLFSSALLAGLVAKRARDLQALADDSIARALALLAIYLGLRLLPGLDHWGLRKWSELVVFGSVALSSGYLISIDKRARSLLVSLLSWLAVPITFTLVIQAGTSLVQQASGISDAYQLTGLFLAMSLFASLDSRRWTCAIFAVVGLLFVAHIAAVAFSAAAILVLVLRGGISRKAVVIGVGVAAVAAIAVVLLGPPPALMRALYKVVAIADALRFDAVKDIANLLVEVVGGETWSTFKPESSQADRLDIMASGIHTFLEHPLFGAGYGKVDYFGHRTAHNNVIEMLAEGGAVAGVLTFYVLTASALRAVSGPVFTCGCFTVMALTAMVSGYFGERLLMFVLGFVLAVSRSPVRE